MTEQKYKELNNYLNLCFTYLDKRDWFLLENIKQIIEMNDMFLTHINNYEITQDYKQNTLTFSDIYSLAREIIESLDKKYLADFDKLIETGELDFDYEDKLYQSLYIHTTKDNQIFNLIDLHRSFNYVDVVILIHEYFHYINGRHKHLTSNWYILTEFFSIYFEMYATEYLINKGIPKEEINYNNRLNITIHHAKSLRIYEIVFMAFEKFGNINENTVNDLNEYVCRISKKQFEKECNNVLHNFKKIEKNYRNDILYEEDYNEEKLSEFISLVPSIDYKYVVGTLLAIYAMDYSNIDKILKLNDTIHENTDDINDVLNEIGIDTDNIDFFTILSNSLDKYIDKFNNKKVM